MLERLGVEQRFSVFDAGSASSQTVAFFSDYQCRLHFADVFDDDALANQEELTEEELTAQFTQLLNFAEEPFDLCLLWDLPNYLNPKALRAFGAALRPFIHRQTLAHGFCAFKESQPFDPRRYGICAADTLIAEAGSHPVGPRFPMTQSTLVAALPFFSVVRGTLLTDGRVELYLEVI